MKPYKFIPGGDYQYWPNALFDSPVATKFHFNPNTALPEHRVMVKNAFADAARQMEFYHGTPMIEWGGEKVFPKQATDPANWDLQYNMIHMALASEMFTISGSSKSLGFSKIAVDQDIIQGIEIWLNFDMPHEYIPSVLLHELTHCKYMLGHSPDRQDVSVMRVNYFGRNSIERSRSRESYQAPDLFGMGAKYYMPPFLDRFWVNRSGDLVIPMVGHPTGEPTQYFSVRHRLVIPQRGDAHQAIKKVVNWDGPLGES